VATKKFLLASVLVLGPMFTAGCATKGYVRSTVQPVSTKLDQVEKSTNDKITETNQKLDQTNQKVDQNTQAIATTKETADAADKRSTDAMNLGQQHTTQISDLNNVVGNIDQYKKTDQAVVLFGLNKHNLTDDAKAQLDKVANDVQGMQRYLITVQGYTDQTGSANYNDQLSRLRAESVIRYLVADHNIPVFRIHMVGLGERDLVNNGKTRDDRKQSRRVEVGVYVAPTLTKSGSQ
jgi:OmpA-OmpF porin, OOP family